MLITGGKRYEKTIIADQTIAGVLAYSDLCRVVTLQVAPGYRNHIIRSGRIEGDSLCYVVLVLNDLAPIGLIPGLGSGDRPESSGIGPRLPLGKRSTWLVMLGPVDVFRSFSSRVSHISKDKLDKSHMALPDHEKLLRYRAIRTAAIVAEMKRRGVEVTGFPYHIAFVLEESIENGKSALPMDSSTEPAAEPCGGMWVGDPKAWPEWKTVAD